MRLALAALCCAFPLWGGSSCRMVEVAVEAAGESTWSVLGAVAGWLVSSGTPLGVALGTLVGWLIGDDVGLRVENEALEEENAALRSQLDSGPTTGWDAASSWAENLGAAAWPLAIGAVAVAGLLIWRGWRTGRRLKRLECKR